MLCQLKTTHSEEEGLPRMQGEHSADVISSAMGFRGSGSHFLDNTGALCLQGDRWLEVGVLPRTCQHRSWQVRWGTKKLLSV